MKMTMFVDMVGVAMVAMTMALTKQVLWMKTQVFVGKVGLNVAQLLFPCKYGNGSYNGGHGQRKLCT